MRFGKDGWLEVGASGLPVFRVPSARFGSLAADLKGPLGVVWHWTGGVCRGEGAARWLADSIRAFERGKDRPASWHALVAKDGRVFQSIPATMASWHVGRPGRVGGRPEQVNDRWDASAWPGRLFANVNAATFGVELENSGRLERVDGRLYCWPYWRDPADPSSGPDARLEVEAARAVECAGAWYDSFPAAQEQAAARLLQALALAYRVGRDAAQYGHTMFDPSRKEDPGPLWQGTVLPRVLDATYGPE